MQPHTRRWLFLLALSLAGGVLVRLLTATGYSGTALMYLGLPWLVAVLLALTTQHDTAKGSDLGKTTRDSLIVMLGSSFVLGEGFLCVLFFLPIYLLIIGVIALGTSLARRSNSKRSVHLAPLLVALLALEGTHPALTLERNNVLTVEQTTPLTIARLQANLRQPIELKNPTSSNLSRIFPLPYQIDSNGFKRGSEHILHYRYARWLWSNVHEGQLRLHIESMSDHHISVQATDNSSYLATYLNLQRFELAFAPTANGTTRVSLSVHYERSLDPAWYFSPLMRVAITGTAEHLLEQIVLRSHLQGGTQP